MWLRVSSCRDLQRYVCDDTLVSGLQLTSRPSTGSAYSIRFIQLAVANLADQYARPGGTKDSQGSQGIVRHVAQVSIKGSFFFSSNNCRLRTEHGVDQMVQVWWGGVRIARDEGNSPSIRGRQRIARRGLEVLE